MSITVRPTLALVSIKPPLRERTGEPSAAPGPGWFASSWELATGLDVSEGLPADATLDEWLRGWLHEPSAHARQPRAGVPVRARFTASPSATTASA